MSPVIHLRLEVILQFDQILSSTVVGDCDFALLMLLEKYFLFLFILALEVFGDREDNLAAFAIEFDNSQGQVIPIVKGLFGRGQIFPAQMLERDKSLNVIGKIHDNSLVDQAGDLPRCLGTRFVLLLQIVPRIRQCLLVAQRDPSLVPVYAQNHHVDLITLAQNLGWMPDSLRPRHVADVNQSIYTGFYLHECTEIGKVAHLAVQIASNCKPDFKGLPRIGLCLFQTQGDLLFSGVDPQDHHFDFIADIHKFGGMSDMLCPRHLADVNETFNTLFKFNERTVIRDGYDLSDNLCIDRITILNTLPRIGLQLFQSEADAVLHIVVIEHFDLNDIADIDNLTGMVDPAPRHIGDMQQAIHSTQVDECTEIGDVLDGTFADLIFREVGEYFLAHLGPFLLKDHAPAHHDIAPVLVYLDDLEADCPFDKLIEISDLPQCNLRSRQEGGNTHQIDHQSAFDAPVRTTYDDLAGIVGVLDLVPDLHKVGLRLAQNDLAVLVLNIFKVNIYLVAQGNAFNIPEFFKGNRAFTLEAYIDNDISILDGENHSGNDLTFVYFGEGLVVECHHLIIFFRRILFCFQLFLRKDPAAFISSILFRRVSGFYQVFLHLFFFV